MPCALLSHVPYVLLSAIDFVEFVGLLSDEDFLVEELEAVLLVFLFEQCEGKLRVALVFFHLALGFHFDYKGIYESPYIHLH